MEINNILNMIDVGAMTLPEFQRGYVWNRNQARDLLLPCLIAGELDMSQLDITIMN